MAEEKTTQAPELSREEREFFARKEDVNHSKLIRAVVRYTPAEVIRALEDARLIEAPSIGEEAACARLTRADLRWATFLNVEGVPVDLGRIPESTIDKMIGVLAAMYPDGLRIKSAAPAPDEAPKPEAAPKAEAAHATERGQRPSERTTDKDAKLAHMKVPARMAKQFTRTQRDKSGREREVSRLAVRVPKGVRVNGVDVGGCTFFCPCTQRNVGELLSGSDVVCCVPTDRPLSLKGKVGVSEVDPWLLARAIKGHSQKAAAPEPARKAEPEKPEPAPKRGPRR